MTWLDRVTIAFLVLWPFVGWVSHDWMVSTWYGFGETLSVVIFALPHGVVLLWYAFGEDKPKAQRR